MKNWFLFTCAVFLCCKKFSWKNLKLLLVTSISILLMCNPINSPYGEFIFHWFSLFACTYFYLWESLLIHDHLWESFLFWKNVFLSMIICENLFFLWESFWSLLICESLFLFMIICENLFLFMIICENLFFFERMFSYLWSSVRISSFCENLFEAFLFVRVSSYSW